MTVRTLLFILLTYCCIPFSATAQKDDYTSLAAGVLEHVNQHRAHMGLRPLVMNNVISRIAAEHSRNMAAGKVSFSHDGMDNRVSRATKELKLNTSSWAENIASGRLDAAGVVNMWLTSKGHRENIEGTYNMTGIGIAKAKNGTLYFTQIFMNSVHK